MTSIPSITLFLLRIVLGALFLWSGFGKVDDPNEFFQTVQNYQMVPATSGLLVAAILPAIEVIVGLSLLAGVMLGGAFVASVLLGAIFSASNAWVVLNGIAVSCSCFGVSSTEVVGVFTVIRSLLLLVASAAGLVIVLRFGYSEAGGRKSDTVKCQSTLA